MNKNKSEGDCTYHQTVAAGFEFKSGGKSIAVEFTEELLNAQAVTATSWAWLHGTRWGGRLAAALPHRLPESNNPLTPQEKTRALVHGLLGEARQLTHVAFFRRDPLVPELLGIRRVPSQSTLTHFFTGFGSAGVNLACFRPL